MKKALIMVTMLFLMFGVTAPSYGAVDGITKDNYDSWVKTYPDSYGYNKGECDTSYLEGEEYFYNEYYDHWNVGKVYDRSLIPQKQAKKTDREMVNAFCVKHFKKSPKYVKYGSKAVKHHKGKMIVEVVKTKSLGGKWGKTKDGYRLKYNKTVRKGKVVTSYLIYSPKSNSIDAVVAVVDNRMIR